MKNELEKGDKLFCKKDHYEYIWCGCLFNGMSSPGDIVLAVPATICTKCRKPCKLVNMKKLRKEKLDKINDEL